jgi:hypothetical protein
MDINSDKHAGITHWETSFKNRRSTCIILICMRWGITLNKKYFDFLVALTWVFEIVYNYRLSRSRRYVECASGILSNKWRILQWSLNISLEFAVDIDKACVILHNIFHQFQDAMSIVPDGQSVCWGLTANKVTVDYINRRKYKFSWI